MYNEDNLFCRLLGVPRCSDHIPTRRWGGSGLPRDGDSVDESLGRMHAGDNGTNPTEANVHLPSGEEGKCCPL